MNISDIYKGKLFSVLGDSISTLDGYTEPCEAAYYKGMKKFEADVFIPEDTWWGKVIEHFGGFILVNNSISGSIVCKHPDCEIPSYACSDERTSALDRCSESPDVIMVFTGTNDWGRGMRTVPENESQRADLSVFSVAYEAMLGKLRANYTKAELWCFTIPISICQSDENFVFPYCYGGVHIEKYCDVIRDCANKYGCRLIDLYKYGTPHDTIDGFHPNAQGMKTLADSVIAQVEKK